MCWVARYGRLFVRFAKKSFEIEMLFSSIKRNCNALIRTRIWTQCAQLQTDTIARAAQPSCGIYVYIHTKQRTLHLQSTHTRVNIYFRAVCVQLRDICMSDSCGFLIFAYIYSWLHNVYQRSVIFVEPRNMRCLFRVVKVLQKKFILES